MHHPHPGYTPAHKGETTQELICELLSWSADEYSEYMYNAGLAYLKTYMPAYSDGIAEKFEKSRVYWNWYKALHTRIDATIIDDEGTNHFAKLNLATKRALYNDLHDAQKKVQEWKPNKIVWQEATK
ncbi:hypothetical protein LWM68_40760 [Niabella sp. W65]|nr:hypothetical protein [Niabella sp. W65]MCH7368505.1 hypothetical protein [Niabella sp. W65]ULT44095.1 hypothetical protein KRR40_12455 [Niabella sp. I65]